MAIAPDDERREGREPVHRFNPIPWALAAAVLMCSVPFAYQIAECPGGFSGSISPSQLFSFQCRFENGGRPGDPVLPPSDIALRASELMAPSGYVSYRVENGIAREAGSLTLADGSSPPFSRLKVGDLLQATHTKRIRRRPFEQALFRNAEAGSCLKVIAGARIADEAETPSRSGGWLPVTEVVCPI